MGCIGLSLPQTWFWKLSRRKRAGTAHCLQGLRITQAFIKPLFQSVLGVSRLQLGIFLSLRQCHKFCLFKVTLRVSVIYTYYGSLKFLICFPTYPQIWSLFGTQACGRHHAGAASGRCKETPPLVMLFGTEKEGWEGSIQQRICSFL